MDNFIGKKATEGRYGGKMSTRITPPSKLVLAGISLIAAIGLIHLLEAPEESEEATYLGLLFLANFGGAVVAAIGIYRGHGWGWGLGTLVAAGAFIGYVISRTIGLPGMPVEEWLEPLGVLSLLVEALFVGLCLASFVRPAKAARMD